MRKRVPRSRVNNDRWLVSYADFITLLFGLFVVLYAFARADDKKHQQVNAAIDSAFNSWGIFAELSRDPAKAATASSSADQQGMPMNVLMRKEILSQAKVKEDLAHVQKELEQRLSSQVAQHTVSIQMGREGLVISLREAGFFASGSAAPRPDSLVTLHRIADSIGRTAYDLRIEGHTDNIPIHTIEFDSNWELSTARATHIARSFLDQKAASPDRLAAAGYAEFHPVASNSTADGRAENRRVDVVVMPRSNIDLSKSELPRADGAWRKVADK
jgi:chemotaxis protein MotB